MKKFCLLTVSVILTVFMVGCGTTAPAAAPAPAAPTAAAVGPIQDPNVPEWLNDFPPDDVLWGIGSAKQSTDNLSMTMADSRARQDIARQLSVVAKGMVTDYARDAGTIGDTASLQLAESVSRQLTEAKLQGAKPIKRWKAPDGTWWYLVQYSKSDAAKEAAGIIDSEAARYAEFKAMDALNMMNSELEKANTKPTVVSN